MLAVPKGARPPAQRGEAMASARHLRSGGRRYCAALLAVATAGVTSSSSAAPLDFVNIRWLAPPECPRQDAFRSQLLRDLQGSKVSRPLAAEVEIVLRAPQHWQALLRIRDAGRQTERSLSAQRCDALMSVTSLILATMIDPDLVIQRPAEHAADAETEPAGARTTAEHGELAVENAANATSDSSNGPVAGAPSMSAGPVAATAPTDSQGRVAAGSASAEGAAGGNAAVAVTAPPPTTTNINAAAGAASGLPPPHAPPRREQPSQASLGPAHVPALALAAFGLLDGGSLPSTSEALGAAMVLEYLRFRGEAAFAWWVPKRATLNAAPEVAVAGRFGVYALGARGCVSVAHFAALSVLPCVGVELERWRGEGDQPNLARAQSSEFWGVGATLSALGVFRLTQRLLARAGSDAVVFLNPPTFGFVDGEIRRKVFQPDRLALRVHVGAEIDFW
jgi:hypothetical protein